MHDLQATLSTLQVPEMANRIRRVIRDEISCGMYLEVQSIRFDIQIARPQYYTQNESVRHLHVVQRSISYLLKGKSPFQYRHTLLALFKDWRTLIHMILKQTNAF